MANFIKSSEIWVFPCANRTVNLESKLMTEENFTHIPSLAGSKSYMIGEEDGFVYCVIGGY